MTLHGARGNYITGPALAPAAKKKGSKIEVKEAVRAAKEYVADLFADEEIMHVGLEEVEFDHCANVWKITIGFSRPWDRRFGNTIALRERHPTRSYKVVRINAENGQTESIKDRFMVDSRVS